MNIGQIIKAKREALALSQRDVVKRVGAGRLTQAKIAKLENGNQPNVTIATLRVLAEGLRCSVIDLLPDEDKRPRQH
jgi:transcriptional regulator with XRE-family HTH domain